MATVESNIPIPEDKPKRRARKAKSVAKESPASSLISALEFIGHAQQKEGTPYQTHCRFEQHWAMAFNGVLSIGVPIQEDLTACPHTLNLAAALSKCAATLSISQLNENTLRINSEKFRATIDCLPNEQVATSYPDQPVAPIGDEIKAAFEALAWLATENAQKAFCSGVLLQAKTAVATNTHVICEYWHGYDLPPNLLIPKQAITAMLKINKKLVKFGYSPDNSATFWYEDGSYLKTQLFKDQYPQYQMIFERAKSIDYIKMPSDFFKALESVAPFAKEKFVFLKQDKLCSHADEELGATYELAGLQDAGSFNFEYLKAIELYFDNIKFSSRSSMHFGKGSLRGAMMGSNANDVE